MKKATERFLTKEDKDLLEKILKQKFTKFKNDTKFFDLITQAIGEIEVYFKRR